MNKQEKENQINRGLIGKTIVRVNYYLLNRPGYFYPDQPEQLVDAAVELELNDGNYFSFGMNFNYVTIDAFDSGFEEKIKAYNEQLPYLKLDVSADAQWKKYINEKISNCYVNLNWFEDIEEQVHYVPQDLEIVLDNDKYLAFCATAYALEEDGISILGPDSEGEILVLFNEDDTRYFKRGRFSEQEIPEEETELPE